MTLNALQLDNFDGQGHLARDNGVVELPDILTELALRTCGWQKEAVDGAAATTTAERAFHRAWGQSQMVKRVEFIPAASLTADGSHYATLRVRRRTALGADGGVVAEIATTPSGSGDWTAFVPVPLTLTLNESPLLADGESLTMEILKTGNGVAVTVGSLRVFYK